MELNPTVTLLTAPGSQYNPPSTTAGTVHA
jgi:hypothetical protein